MLRTRLDYGPPYEIQLSGCLEPRLFLEGLRGLMIILYKIIGSPKGKKKKISAGHLHNSCQSEASPLETPCSVLSYNKKHSLVKVSPFSSTRRILFQYVFLVVTRLLLLSPSRWDAIWRKESKPKHKEEPKLTAGE